jgi:hypothetical protein
MADTSASDSSPIVALVAQLERQRADGQISREEAFETFCASVAVQGEGYEARLVLKDGLDTP